MSRRTPFRCLHSRAETDTRSGTMEESLSSGEPPMLISAMAADRMSPRAVLKSGIKS